MNIVSSESELKLVREEFLKVTYLSLTEENIVLESSDTEIELDTFFRGGGECLEK